MPLKVVTVNDNVFQLLGDFRPPGPPHLCSSKISFKIPWFVTWFISGWKKNSLISWARVCVVLKE